MFIELLWNMYVDGYTFDHWVSIVWMVSINLGVVLIPVHLWLARND